MARGQNKERTEPAPKVDGNPPPTWWAVLPALIIGTAILAGSLILKSSLDETSAQLASIRSGLNETKVALDAVASAKPAAAEQPQRRRGPDPAKRYTLNTGGRPFKGPASATVEVVEFSDFQ